jgi:hypothetical protein
MVQPIDETITVCVIIKDIPTLNSTYYEVMKSSIDVSKTGWRKNGIAT